MTAHVDCARVADELQFRNWKRFREYGDSGDDSRRDRRGHPDRNNRAASRPFGLVYMSSGINVVMVMDRGTMMMVVALCVLRYRVHVKRERVCLQRADRHGDEGSDQRAHVPSLLDAVWVRQRRAAA